MPDSLAFGDLDSRERVLITWKFKPIIIAHDYEV